MTEINAVLNATKAFATVCKFGKTASNVIPLANVAIAGLTLTKAAFELNNIIKKSRAANAESPAKEEKQDEPKEKAEIRNTYYKPKRNCLILLAASGIALTKAVFDVNSMAKNIRDNSDKSKVIEAEVVKSDLENNTNRLNANNAAL